MEKGVLILRVAATFLVLCMVSTWVYAQQEEITLEDKEVFGKPQRPAVEFNHAKHYEEYPECMECHHIYEYSDGEKENTWAGEEQKCSDCHKQVKEEKKLDLRTAFHENCTGCHQKMRKEGEKTGPVTCGECHIREK